MRKYYNVVSSFISIAIILFLISINITIAEQYLKSDGKTKALFWLIEFGFSFKYYFLLASLLSGYFLFKAYKKREIKMYLLISLFLLILNLLSIFLRFWTCFV